MKVMPMAIPDRVIRGVRSFYAPLKAPAVKIQGFPENLSFQLRNPPWISIFSSVEKSSKHVNVL